MPIWYQTIRSPLLLFQSLVGMMIFAYPLQKRSYYALRLVGAFAACAAVCELTMLRLYNQEQTIVGGAGRFGTMLVVYLSLIVIAAAAYKESVFTALFVASSGYAAQDIGGALKQMAKLTAAGNALTNHNFGVLALDLLCYGSAFLLLWVVFSPYVRKRDENFDNRLKALFSFFVMLLCIGMARITQDIPARAPVTAFAECVYEITCNVLILILQFGVMENAKITREADSMRELVHQQHIQYTASKESMQLVNEKYHDLKRLLQSFQGNVSPAQIKKLEHSIDAYDAQVHTGNDVLDVLLTEKRTLCTQRNIQLTCYAGGADLGFVEELDLYALFSNALNNAIEAVCAMPETEERFITMTAQREGNMLTIHVENPCTGAITFEDGLPQSKRDPRYHGFGMKSMERTAEKYGGSVSARQAGAMFYLDILLFDE